MEQIMSIICTVGALLLLLLIGYLRMRGNVKEWLLWAVTQAEQYLGSGTGALKLRYVYDLAVEAFPPIKLRTSSTVTRLTSPSMVCLSAEAAAANSTASCEP